MEYTEKTDITALILGGHINAYGIARTLFQKCKLVAIADKSAMISVSKLLDDFIVFNKNQHSIVELINFYATNHLNEKIVLFATADWHLDEICQQSLAGNVHWGSRNFDTQFNSKIKQYQLAEKSNVCYPKSLSGFRDEVITALTNNVNFVNVVKPISRDNRELDADSYFRAKKFSNNHQTVDFLKSRSANEQFLVSEVINAHPSEVWSCLCICEKGEIIGCWTGRKLSQSPWEFGVFASAVAEWNEKVFQETLALVRHGGFTGVVQPEFKFCKERNKYYLMEINFRYMMWHYTGKLAGVNLPEIDIAHTLNMPLPDLKINNKQRGQSKVYTFNTLHLINALKRDHPIDNLKLFMKFAFNPFIIHASFCIRDWMPFLKNTFGRFKK